MLKEPESLVGVGELADNSVNLWVRPWVASSDYLSVHLDLVETIKKTFDAEGLNFPFPQRVVTIQKED